jgi:hypothetical protein
MIDWQPALLNEEVQKLTNSLHPIVGQGNIQSEVEKVWQLEKALFSLLLVRVKNGIFQVLTYFDPR